jgi:hypothetical protein
MAGNNPAERFASSIYILTGNCSMPADKKCLSIRLAHDVLIPITEVSFIRFTEKYLRAHFKEH